MTTRQIIQKLISEGHSVRFRERSKAEGSGVRITQIDGIRYSGSKGNIAARQLTGATLSERRERHLKHIEQKAKRFGRKRKSALPEDITKRIERVQRRMRKQGTKAGTITRRNIRFVIENYGVEEARRLLESAERYSKGLAYYGVIEALLQRLALDYSKKNSEAIQRIYNAISEMKETFLEAWIADVYEILYEYEKGTISGAEAERRINAIIK